MKAKPIGIYLHIPFCIRKCNYCDFCSLPGCTQDFISDYTDAIIREIRGYSGKGILVDTVFFGGGTPTLLSGEEHKRIMKALAETFEILPGAEITMEANPKTLTKKSLSEYIASGVNRISLGLQSIHENELKMLGRIHTFEDFFASYKLCRECGISNINIDLMYGIPEQTEASFDQTLKAVLALSPEHISVYGLIVEEGTRFYDERDALNLPDEDTEKNMYLSAVRALTDAGYAHYEISNYARPGKKSRHNLKYWRDEEYLGFGAAAYSYFDGVRFGNTDSVTDYIAGGNIRAYSEKTSGEDIAFEFAMLALRLDEGISEKEYQNRFGTSFYDGRSELIDKYSDAGLIRRSNGRISLTDEGFYLSNTILSEIL